MEAFKRVKVEREKTKKELSAKSWIEIYRNVLDSYEANLKDLMDSMWDEERPSYRLFNRQVVSHRTQRFYGVTENVKYDFTGSPVETITDLHPLVQQCMDFANKETPEFSYNGGLVNLYKTGTDCIGMHSDKEKDMVPNAPIYSFSFGFQRTFVIEPKSKDSDLAGLKLQMPDNSLIVMCGEMQREFEHGVPKLPKKEINRLPEFCARINITIRAMIPRKQ